MRLAVIGDPVDHSASPALHRRFLAEAGLAGTYEAIRVAAGDGARAIDELRARGYTGLNVTTPLKEEAFARAERRDAAALASGSVNTLLLGETVRGLNTDGTGALGALRDEGLRELGGARLLVLGTGPTARAVCAALTAAGAATFVWSRSAERARAVAATVGAHAFETADPAARFDAIFSALPPGAFPDDETVRAHLRRAPLVIDANYGERSTLGRALGRPVVDGAAMLLHGARASFEAFRAAT